MYLFIAQTVYMKTLPGVQAASLPVQVQELSLCVLLSNGPLLANFTCSVRRKKVALILNSQQIFGVCIEMIYTSSLNNVEVGALTFSAVQKSTNNLTIVLLLTVGSTLYPQIKPISIQNSIFSFPTADSLPQIESTVFNLCFVKPWVIKPEE